MYTGYIQYGGGNLNLKLSKGSTEPIYIQIYNEIREAIITSKLKDGSQVPSIRMLAKELEVSVITVKRAYEDLDRDGYMYSIPGKGYFVQKQDAGALEAYHLNEIDKHIFEIKNIANLMGLNYQEMLSYIKEKL